MATFTLYQRTIDLSQLRKIDDLDELVFPTGKHWLSGNRDQYYCKVMVANAYNLEELWDLAQNGNQKCGQTLWYESDMRSASKGDVIVNDNGDEWLVDSDGFTKLESTSNHQLDVNMSIPNTPLVNDLGQEIIDHIHHVLKQCGYKHPMKSAWLTIVERICDGYFKADGLLKLANQLNVP